MRCPASGVMVNDFDGDDLDMITKIGATTNYTSMISYDSTTMVAIEGSSGWFTSLDSVVDFDDEIQKYGLRLNAKGMVVQ